MNAKTQFHIIEAGHESAPLITDEQRLISAAGRFGHAIPVYDDGCGPLVRLTPMNTTLSKGDHPFIGIPAQIELHTGWTKGDGTDHEGYNVADYFDNWKYLGPDEHGIEPIFREMTRRSWVQSGYGL